MTNLRPKLLFEEPWVAPAREEALIYHSITLPEGELTGEWDLRPVIEDYLCGVVFKEKTFLDVGTATGFLSFEAERRGASAVVSVDAAEKQEEDAVPWKENRSESPLAQMNEELLAVKRGYWLCWHALQSKAKVVYQDVHALPEALSADVVMAGCVLLHLRDPVRALFKVASLCRETLVVADLLPVERDFPTLLPNFAAKTSRRNPKDLVSWWGLPPRVISRALEVVGFETVEVREMSIRSPAKELDADFYSLRAERR